MRNGPRQTFVPSRRYKRSGPRCPRSSRSPVLAFVRRGTFSQTLIRIVRPFIGAPGSVSARSADQEHCAGMKFESNGAAAAWGSVDVTNAHAGTRAEIRLESSDARSTFVLVVLILLASCGGTPTAPPPSILSLGGVPATATAGVPIAAVVTANDGFGAPFAGYRGSVHFSST